MNRSRHSCCLSNILNIKSRCFVRSWQCGWSNNKSFLVWHHWVTPIQSHGVFVLTSWHQPPLTNKKALLSWHHKMTSPLSNQEAHLWWRHSAPIKRTSHTIFFILKVEDWGGGGGWGYFPSHLGSERRSWHFSDNCNDQNATERIAAARENVQSVNETELPVAVCISTHDKHCLPHCLSNWFLTETAITRERQHRRAVSR